MENNQKHFEEIEKMLSQDTIWSGQSNGDFATAKTIALEKNNKMRFPYEFLASVDRGWIPCDILETDTTKELVKVIFYHPDSDGWMETCKGGVFDEVVQMWRVRLRED